MSLYTLVVGSAVLCGIAFLLIFIGFLPLPAKRRRRKSSFAGTKLIVLLCLFLGGVWFVTNKANFRLPSFDAVANAAAHIPVTEDCRKIAQAAGYGNVELLCAFYHAQPPISASGQKFPWYVAAAVVNGETNTAQGVECDPRKATDCGRHIGWNLAPDHFPLSRFPAPAGRDDISNMALKCREGLNVLAQKVAHTYPGISGQNMHTSKGCSVGRTQILAVHFASGGMFADRERVDVWNDYSVTADLTYGHLAYAASPKCGGSWMATGNVSYALCSYNPNSWGVTEHQWYWNAINTMSEKLRHASEEQLTQGANTHDAKY